MRGFDVGSNGVVATFDLYVSIDGVPAKRFVTVAGGRTGGTQKITIADTLNGSLKCCVTEDVI